MLHKMPIILIALIAAIMILDPLLPIEIKQILFAIGLTIKSIIIFLLPIVIFGLLFKAVVTLAGSAGRIILLIIIGVCCSNFISTFLSHYVGMWIYNFNLSIIPPSSASDFTPYWTFELPQLIANNKAMFSAIILGMVLAKINKNLANKIAEILEKMIAIILGYFAYLIPLFVIGFVVKLQSDNVISTIIKDYTMIFVIIALTQFSYIALLYVIFSKGKIASAASNIKNMLPAAITGFSAMSSAAAMPLTIIGAENNAKNKDLAKSVIPMTVNIHLIGDCIAIPIFAYAVLKNYGMAEPSLLTYMIFAGYFVLAKFSVAAIPGGGIIVMLPILQNYLSFNGEMMSLITALYILFDPVITCVNVLGNGAFAKMMELLVARTSKKALV